MKWLLSSVFIVAVLMVPRPALGQTPCNNTALPGIGVTCLTSASSQVTSSTGVTPSVTINATGATLIVMSQATNQSTTNAGLNEVCNPSSSPANTWQPGPEVRNSGTGQAQRLFYVLNPTVSATMTISCTNSTYAEPAISVAAFSGANFSVDRLSLGSTPSPTGDESLDLDPVTPSNANQLVIAGLAQVQNASVGVSMGWSLIESRPQTSFARGTAMAIRTTASPAATSLSWTPDVPFRAAGSFVTFATTPLCTRTSSMLTATSWPQYRACVTAAQDGDTVQMAAGVSDTAGLGERIVTGKWLTLDFNGATIVDNTCNGQCTTSGTEMFLFTESPLGHTVLKNLIIQQGTAIHQTYGTVGNRPATNGQMIRVTGVTYYDKNGAGDFLTLRSSRALIDHNKFFGRLTSACQLSAAMFLRIKTGEERAGWQVPMRWGDKDEGGNFKVYVEDNELYMGAFDIDDNGRVVTRFNYGQYFSHGDHGADTSFDGNRGVEFYNNTWAFPRTPQCGTPPTLWVDMPNGSVSARGGSQMVLNNEIAELNIPQTNPKTTLLYQVQSLTRSAGPGPCWRGGWPAAHQPGWGFTVGGTMVPVTHPPGAPPRLQDPEPIIIAGNFGSGNFTSPGRTGGPYQDCDTPTPPINDYLQMNRDIFAQAGNGGPNTPGCNLTTPSTCQFNGTTGTGYGARADRPQTCTSIPGGRGVYYWSTDIGNWNHTSTGGQGVLDRCTSTNVWNNGNDAQPFYTPYIYPHPMNDVPHVPQMSFEQQPTVTVYGNPFAPPIRVKIPGGAPDMLSLSLIGAGCGPLSGTTNVQATATGAVFTGVRPGSTGSSCRVRVTNLTNSALGYIDSAPFNVAQPPGPTLAFVQQPTTTTVGFRFSPIKVTLSTGAADVIRLTLDSSGSGNCSIIGRTQLPAVAGVGAVFPDVVAASAGEDCVLKAADLTDATATATISDPFNILGISSVPMTIVNGGNAYGCVNTPPLVNQANGSTFDTTNADLLIMVVNAQSAGTIIDEVGGVQTAGAWTEALVVEPIGIVMRQRVFYKHPTTTGYAARFQYSAPQPYDSMCVIALHGSNGAGSIAAAGSNTTTVSLTLAAENFFLLSGFMLPPEQTVTSGPTGFSTPVRNNVGSRYGTAMAWKFTTGPTETATWVRSAGGGGSQATSLIAFAPANTNGPPPVMPVLSFSTQPPNTVNGQTMGAFTVTSSVSISGTVTLVPVNCAGVLFSNLAATISGTSVSFNMTVPTGTANGCHFTASFPGATSADSAMFNVTTNVVPPPSTLATGLISYWKMDEASGQALDSCSNNHLQVRGTIPSLAGGVIGSARQQTNANSTRVNYLEVPSNPSLQANGSFSVSLWVLLHGQPTRTQFLIGKDTQTAPNRDWLLQMSGGQFSFTLFQGGVNPNVTSTGAGYSTGVWYHIIVWFDQSAGTINMEVRRGTGVNLYSTPVGSAAPDATNAPFSVFSRSNTALDFYGAIDEVAFAKRVWTLNERQQLYNNGNGYPYSNFPCNASGPALVFTQQPQNVVNGNLFPSTVAGTVTGVPNAQRK